MTNRNPDSTVRVLQRDTDPPIPVEIADFTGDINVTIPGTVDVSDRPARQVGEVSLTAAVLAALETIHAIVDNWPGDYPDAAGAALLTAIQAALAGTLTVDVTDTEFGADLRVGGMPVTALNPVPVDATITLGDVEITNDTGNPIPVSGTVSVAEPVSIDDNGASITVDATNLDVRDLAFATDKVDVSGSTVTVAEPVTVDGVVTANLGTIDGVATEATLLGVLTDAQLRATPVPVSGTVSVVEPVTVDGEVALGAATLAALETINIGTMPEVEISNDTGNPVPAADDFFGGEVLADQSGPGVLTFTFAADVNLLVMLSTGTDLTSRADPFGGVPSSSAGIHLDDGVMVYVPVITASVDIYAPSGAAISVWGLRR